MDKYRINFANKVILFAITAMVVLFSASIVVAGTDRPIMFMGTLQYQSCDNVSAGAEICAYIDGELRGDKVTTVDGQYGIPPGDFTPLTVIGDSADNGKNITFTVDGVQADPEFPITDWATDADDSPHTLNLIKSADLPAITDWSNDKTNSNATSITVNESESVRFNATADQIIDTWKWFKDGADQSNDFDNYTTSWSVNGTYTVSVNATNTTNGTSNTVTWTITVNDTTPPVISDVANSTPTSSSVTITWTTDEASDSIVKYGNTSGSYTANVSNTTKVTLHSIALSGLDSNMAYYFVVNSTDASGNSNESSEYNFTTATEDDTTPPVISDVANSTPTSSSVTITWTTDEASDSIVKYGNTSGSYTANVSNTTKVTLHSIALSGLDSNMAYYFVVNSTDASGNSNESSEYNFTTATEDDTTPPVISDVANSTPTSSSVTITWTTDEASDSIVKYGNASGSYTANVSNTTKVTLHSIALSGLDSNMAYYFVVNSTDASGNSNESSEYNFTTVETTVNISITLIGGWNLIAIPVYPLNATVASVFADVNMFGKSVYKYGSGGYEVVTTVEPKVGYWVFSVGSPTIWIEGTPVTS